MHVSATPAFSKTSKDNSAVSSIKIFPVPVHYILSAEYTLKQNESVKINIADVSGKTVLQFNNGFQVAGSYQTRINVSKLHKGLYVFQMQSGNSISTLKFEKL